MLVWFGSVLLLLFFFSRYSWEILRQSFSISVDFFMPLENAAIGSWTCVRKRATFAAELPFGEMYLYVLNRGTHCMLCVSTFFSSSSSSANAHVENSYGWSNRNGRLYLLWMFFSCLFNSKRLPEMFRQKTRALREFQFDQNPNDSTNFDVHIKLHHRLDTTKQSKKVHGDFG